MFMSLWVPEDQKKAQSWVKLEIFITVAISFVLVWGFWRKSSWISQASWVKCSHNLHIICKCIYFLINSSWITFKRKYSFLSGQSPADAEFNFLEVAKNLDLYGVDLHFAKVLKKLQDWGWLTLSSAPYLLRFYLIL